MIYLLSVLLFIGTALGAVSTPARKPKNELLIGLSSSTTGFDRRQLIRENQINIYKEGNFGVTWKFVLFRPHNDTIRERIMQENATYGDIIILEKYEDSKKNAIWVKPYEWFEYVEANMTKYNYVAKMDDDTFMNITGFYQNIFTNRIRRRNDSIIAAWHLWINDRITFPHGAFYAISWDLMVQINRRYEVEPLHFPDSLEDVQVAIFLRNASIPFRKVRIEPHSCNWKNHDRPSGMSKCNVTQQHLNKWENIVRVHLLKDTDVYQNISSYFVKHEKELRVREVEAKKNKLVNPDNNKNTELTVGTPEELIDATPDMPVVSHETYGKKDEL